VDGVDAVEYYTRHADEIDLILVDLVMPRMGGPRVLPRAQGA
jgi:CheY-like chemotaxis protein